MDTLQEWLEEHKCSSMFRDKRLYVRGEINNLPDIITLMDIQGIELNANGLKVIPEQIFKMQNLHHLGVFNNKIREIPESIYKLKLTELYLFGNKIKNVPENICKLKRLEQLWLSFNEISTIPSSISKMKHLYEVRFNDNNNIIVPAIIGKLSNLLLCVDVYNIRYLKPAYYIYCASMRIKESLGLLQPVEELLD